MRKNGKGRRKIRKNENWKEENEKCQGKMEWKAKKAEDLVVINVSVSHPEYMSWCECQSFIISYYTCDNIGSQRDSLLCHIWSNLVYLNGLILMRFWKSGVVINMWIGPLNLKEVSKIGIWWSSQSHHCDAEFGLTINFMNVRRFDLTLHFVTFIQHLHV